MTQPHQLREPPAVDSRHPADTAPPLSASRLLARIGWLALTAVVSLAYAALLVNWSWARGKLASTPTYDDIIYLLDGIKRLHVFYEEGLWAWLAGLFTNPPHSPFSSYLASVSYAVWGPHTWAPYLGNALIIFVLLLGVAYLTRGIGPVQRILLAGAVLAFPITGMAVSEFRPDIMYALLAALGACLLVRRPLAEAGWGELHAAGLLFAASLLCKTTTFPLVLAVFGASLLSAIYQPGLWRRPGEFPGIAKRLVACLWPLPVIVLPFYANNITTIFSYLFRALVTDAQLWNKPRDFKDHLTYYLMGEAPAEMLGAQAWLLIAAFAGLLVAWSARLRLRAYGRFALPLLVAFLVPTISQMKYPFAGTLLYWMAILLAVILFRDLWAYSETPPAFTPPKQLLSLGLHLAVFAAMLFWRPPYQVIDRFDPVTRLLNQAESGAVRAIEARAPMQRRTTVFCQFLLRRGFGLDALQYRLLLDGFANVQLIGSLTAPLGVNDLQDADFLLLTEPSNPFLARQFPASQTHEQLYTALTADPRFRLVESWPLPFGATLQLYERRSIAAETQPSSGAPPGSETAVPGQDAQPASAP